jgi:uncharacterized membrane protein
MNASTVYDFIHLLAAAVWIGGGLFANFVFTPSLAVLEPQHRGRMAATVGKRFSKLAWITALLLLLAGFLRTPSHILFNTSSTYGLLLMLKLVVVLALVVNGIMMSIVIGPKLESLLPKPGEAPLPEFFRAQKMIGGASLFASALGVLLLFLVALMHTSAM